MTSPILRDELDLVDGLVPRDADAEVLALHAEGDLEWHLEELVAADSALAAATARRYRAIAAVKEASLQADERRDVAIEARRAAIADRDGAGRASPAAGALSPTRRSSRSTEISERSARAEIALALRMSEAGGASLVEAAELMLRRHPVVLDAMRAGRIRDRHATRLVRSVAELPPEAADAVVAEAMPSADRSFSSFERLVDRLVRRAHPTSLEQRHARAADDRSIWIEAERDGMAVLSALLPAVDAQAAFDRATAMAKELERDPDDTRTRGQLRADIVRDLLIDGETDSLPDSVRGIRPTVFVTVPALAIATDDDAFGEAEIDGAGPIDLETATRLVGAASEWMRILTHPITGMVLSVDRRRYRPPAAIARLARWSHRTCTFPGCRTAAHRCELDHIVDWAHGGGTGIGNLHPLCTSHHTIKHATRWQVVADSGGVTWTSPGGQVATSASRAAWRAPSTTVVDVIAASDPASRPVTRPSASPPGLGPALARSR